MGCSLSLVPKIRDHKIFLKILDCTNKDRNKYLSDKFGCFQSRFVFEQSEIEQVQQILSIDLSTYLKYPKNHWYDTGELEYELYLAEKKNDDLRVEEIRKQIKAEIKNWELTYYTNHEGWSSIEEFRKITLDFISVIKRNPDFGSKLNIPVSIEFPWGNYFSMKEKENEYDRRILEDLDFILHSLECIEKHGIQYVGFVGE
jgi:hypothetical protein